MEHKKYALLETGDIEPLYYSSGKPRRVEKEGKHYYLMHDVFLGSCIALMQHKIIKEAETQAELLEAQKAFKKTLKIR